MPLDAITLVYNILQSARTSEMEGTLVSLSECGDYGNHIVLKIVIRITKMTIFFSPYAMCTLYCEFRMPRYEKYEPKLIASRYGLRRFSTLLSVKKVKFMVMSLLHAHSPRPQKLNVSLCIFYEASCHEDIWGVEVYFHHS
jgi:hypothetical protein